MYFPVELKLDAPNADTNLHLCIQKEGLIGPAITHTSLSENSIRREYAEENLWRGLDAECRNLETVNEPTGSKYAATDAPTVARATMSSLFRMSAASWWKITSRDSVGISGVTPLRGGELNPIAAISYWADRAFRQNESHAKINNQGA
ncbi:hypothetical protein EV178_000680 [Coemansia sp. RSA 1646]|nr:hypothetical protein EV178_000680 [Coemansia sp. RSA 1646]